VPEIIKRMGAGTVPPIDDAEYDRLFIVTLIDPGHATVVTLHYAGRNKPFRPHPSRPIAMCQPYSAALVSVACTVAAPF
jgi:hypothetical protein